MGMYKLYGASLGGFHPLNIWLHHHLRNRMISPLIKGTIVPDLQTELKKLETLSFDDEGKTQPNGRTMLPHAFKPTNNVSRETFNYIKANPAITRLQVAEAMENRGFKKSSTLSLTSQFTQQGLVRKANGGLFVTQPEYTPIKSNRKIKEVKVAKVTAKKIETPIIAAVAQPEVQHDTLVKAMLSRMSILQAREMYDELKKVFSS